MKPKAFWIYAIFGLCAAIVIAALCVGIGHFALAEKDPAYRDYLARREAYDGWYAARKLDPRQVRFDEVLAGRMPADSIRDAGLRALAEDIRTLALGEADVSGRGAIISSLFIDEDADLGIRAWISCKSEQGRRCALDPVVASLGNPERLATLLGNDETAKRAALPEVPLEFREPPAWGGGAEKRYPLLERARELPKPWIAGGLWIAVSCAFALGFFLLGYAKHRNAWRSDPYPDPFRSMPHFLLGWIVYLAMLPGVLLMQTLRLVTGDAQPMYARLKHKMAGRTFASEHERMLSQLEGLETRAAGRPDSDATLKLIRDAIAKVKRTQNLEELDKLRKVAADIKLQYEVQEELRETLA